MRSNAATTTTMTDTTDEDQGDGARAVKRARLVWTPQLHKRFEEAVAKLGHEKSIPKNIMQVGTINYKSLKFATLIPFPQG